MDRRGYLRTLGGLEGIGTLAGCSSGEASGTEPSESDPTVEMVTATEGYYFDPVGLFVEPETTITFRNDSGSHSVTAYVAGLKGAETTRIPKGGPKFDTPVLRQEGATESVTFDVEGTYDYFCLPHREFEMVGRIVVGSPGGPAEGTMPPDGPVPESDRILDSETVGYGEFVN